jgi:hypothetical protein
LGLINIIKKEYYIILRHPKIINQFLSSFQRADPTVHEQFTAVFRSPYPSGDSNILRCRFVLVAGLRSQKDFAVPLPDFHQRLRGKTFSFRVSRDLNLLQLYQQIYLKKEKNNMLASLSRSAARVAVQQQRGFKVGVVGAAGGIGQPLSLLMKLDPLVSELSLYDVVRTPGVAADISHCCTPAKVTGHTGDAEIDRALSGCQLVIIPAGKFF